LAIRDVEDTTEIVARRKIIIDDLAHFEIRDVSAYDYLKSLLVQIRERYADADDRDDLIIAAENQIIYDKIVQIMDVARSANLPNISIAKLRL
jgi:biopolymer transport protein ExbD